MVKDDGAILRAYIVPLPVQRRGIVRFPERLDHFFVGGFRRIELDLYDFCVAGVAFANLFVVRILCVAA